MLLSYFVLPYPSCHSSDIHSATWSSNCGQQVLHLLITHFTFGPLKYICSYLILCYHIHLVPYPSCHSSDIHSATWSSNCGQQVLHLLITHFTFGIFLKLTSFFLQSLTIFTVTSNVLTAAQLLDALAITFSLKLASYFPLFVGVSMSRLSIKNT